jgi:FKBP-type peptidyl-prolyl cis-trans isomerase
MPISKKLVPLAFAFALAAAAGGGTAQAQAPGGVAEYLARNAREPGVMTLPSGVQYKVVHAGDPNGPSPKVGDVIKVNYEGTLVDGTVFDSTYKRGKAALMQLAELIPGWMDALPHMHVGDEWMLYVPPELGYGEQRSGPIPPDSILIFRLQLVGMLSAD